jgi:hypothetical protein
MKEEEGMLPPAKGKTLVIHNTNAANAQSLVGKVNEMSCAASGLDPDITIVTETWFNKDISDSYSRV